MSIQLTKDSDALICLLYKQYCKQRKEGVSKQQARMFGSSIDIHAKIITKWTAEDVDETCKELDRAGLLGCFYADNIAYETWLTDSSIIYMEGRFKRGLDEVASYIETLKSFLPF